MGAISFVLEGIGVSASSVFDSLVAKATYEHGNDPYNGSINTCNMGRMTKSYPKYTKTREESAIKFANSDMKNVGKRVANYIDLGVVHYEVITLKKEHTGAKPRYKMQYVVKNGIFDSKTIKGFDTKKEADDYAISLAIKSPKSDLYVEKEYVLIEGKSITTLIVKDVKTYKSKPNLKPMPNRIIRPIHKYIFYGWAAW